MKRVFLILTVVMMLTGCGGRSGTENGKDSVNTDPITDPSYNPTVEADSAAKHMNLDSTLEKDSANPR